MDFSNLVGDLGFPIGCVIILGGYVKGLLKQARVDADTREKTLLESNRLTRRDSMAREKILMDANKGFAMALNKSSDAITANGKVCTALYESFRTVEHKVDSLGNDVNEVKALIKLQGGNKQ